MEIRGVSLKIDHRLMESIDPGFSMVFSLVPSVGGRYVHSSRPEGTSEKTLGGTFLGIVIQGRRVARDGRPGL
jgi:hypothetical protein